MFVYLAIQNHHSSLSLFSFWRKWQWNQQRKKLNWDSKDALKSSTWWQREIMRYYLVFEIWQNTHNTQWRRWELVLGFAFTNFVLPFLVINLGVDRWDRDFSLLVHFTCGFPLCRLDYFRFCHSQIIAFSFFYFYHHSKLLMSTDWEILDPKSIILKGLRVHINGYEHIMILNF